MKIITLIENLVYKQGLVAEHGLSLYIQTGDKKILFDTGQSGLFMKNAAKLGINIEDIDMVILSHGHYDHTGGLYAFLQNNTKAKVYAKSEIFTPKYHGQSRFIGIEKNEELLRDRFVPIHEVTAVCPDVFIMPHITIHSQSDTHFRGMLVKQGEEFMLDEFNDELFITMKHNGQINIITACSHRGITNICQTATDYFKLPVNLILGGFHIKECTISQYEEIVNYLRVLQPQTMGVCHCTGIEKYALMQNDFHSNISYNFTGYEHSL